MDMNLFMDKLLARALECGLTAAEIYYVESNDFSAGAKQGEINSYKVSETCALGLRGLWNGKMGYASTEAFDDEAIEQLIDGVKESAELVETEEQDEIFPGEESYPTLPETETDIATVTAEEKLDAALTLEKTVKEADPRIVNVPAANVQSTVATVRLKNTYGLDLSSTEKMIAAVAGAIACEGKSTTVGYQVKAAPKFADIDIAALGKEAADWALAALNGKAVEAGEYRIIMHREAMCDLLRTFSGIFSAENAQRQMSLLAGKEGTKVASDAVTLMDDPLLPGGFGSGTFDAEGSACRTKTVIENGILNTLLHSRKTARKQGVETTGNASRPSVTAPIRVAPTNFFFKPGEKDLDALMEQMGDGLVITELAGLHSGANAISGDFSLLSKGYRVENGKRTHAVEQITVAGNFYQLLANIREVGSDLLFPASSIGSPSVDVGTLTVAGK